MHRGAFAFLWFFLALPTALEGSHGLPTASDGTAAPQTLLGLSEEFLGASAGRTVVRFTVTISRSDLRGSGDLAPRAYKVYVAGEAKNADGEIVDTFREPVDIDFRGSATDQTLSASFLRALPPGNISLRLAVQDEDGGAAAARITTIAVPEMRSDFRAQDVGTLTAPAILLEQAARENAPSIPGDLIRFLPPPGEVPVGLLRVECDVRPPVTRVEFFLGNELLLARNRPPWEAEIDLGKVPRKQTLRALGYDRLGNLVDADFWAINQKEAGLAVRILDLARGTGTTNAEVKVSVHSRGGDGAARVALYLDDLEIAEWSAPPYRKTIPAADLAKASLMRASAWDTMGGEYSDYRMLEGGGRLVANVEVNLVELNVSVLDASGRFAKGLGRADFTVLEDGVPQALVAFEVAESLPITLGLVIDGSGSMDKTMTLVRQAATDFTASLLGERDKGFVVEFRERPTLLAGMTSSREELVRAIGETRAGGATAFHDSVVLGLYQFRALAGRKALVVLTDGRDNYSSTDWQTVRRYARTAAVPVFFIAFELSILDVDSKARLRELAADTGGEAFVVGDAADLPGIYRKIESELRSQYFLSYLAKPTREEGEFRTVRILLGRPGFRARTIRGYFP